MNRITIDRVVAAYKKTNFQPLRGDWFDTRAEDDSAKLVTCGCPLTTLAVAEYGYALPEGRPADPEEIAFDIGRALGLTEDYVEGFLEGFDGYKYAGPTRSKGEFEAGHADGEAVYDALKTASYTIRSA